MVVTVSGVVVAIVLVVDPASAEAAKSMPPTLPTR